MIYIDKFGENTFYYRSKDDYAFNPPVLKEDESIFTLSSEIYEKYSSYNVNYLNDYLSIPSCVSLYEVFSHYFSGKVVQDINMLQAIFDGVLKDSSYCFCLKLGVNFCWFKLTPNGIVKVGKLQYSDTLSIYNIGKFMKKLYFEIAMTGFNINKIKFLYWSFSDVSFHYVFEKAQCLQTLFDRVENLRGLNYKELIVKLDKNIKNNYSYSASTLITCLSDNFKALGIKENNGIICCNNYFYKDYSLCQSNIFDLSKCSFGVIVDCEGKRNPKNGVYDGCRELGGIIYYKYNNTIINMESFSCDDILLADTLLQVFHDCQRLFNRHIKFINVLTFGGVDEVMITSSLKNTCNRQEYKAVYNKLKFIDCLPFIKGFISGEKSTLESVAKELGVCLVKPQHNPINDARTLFNVLAQILLDSNEFVI